MQALRAERRKARGQGDTLLALAVAAMAVLWWLSSEIRTLDAGANGYAHYLYQLPIINTICMPVAMAALASRSWDIEHKGMSLRLLFTLQSRESLFAAKALRGLAQCLLIGAVEGLSALGVGAARGYTGLDAGRLAFTVLSTGVVNAMLYFAALLCSVRSDTQVLTLGMGALESLVGIFGAFMPPKVALCMPWAYMIPLMTVGMDWDAQTRLASFRPLPLAWPLLGVSVVLAVMLAFCARRAILRKEV